MFTGGEFWVWTYNMFFNHIIYCNFVPHMWVSREEIKHFRQEQLCVPCAVPHHAWYGLCTHANNPGTSRHQALASRRECMTGECELCNLMEFGLMIWCFIVSSLISIVALLPRPCLQPAGWYCKGSRGGTGEPHLKWDSLVADCRIH